jgi:Tfp pilus assembly protein PilN
MSRLSAAVGAALLDGQKINLIPEEVKYRYRILLQKISKPQYMLPAFLAILLLIYSGFWLYAYTLKSELDSIEKKLQEYKPHLETLEAMEKAIQAEKRKQMAFTTYRTRGTKMPKIFEELSSLIPQSVFINVLNLTPNELHMWGTVFGKGDTAENILSKFVLALSASEHIQDVELIQAVKNYDYVQGAFNFEIVAKLKL